MAPTTQSTWKTLPPSMSRPVWARRRWQVTTMTTTTAQPSKEKSYEDLDADPECPAVHPLRGARPERGSEPGADPGSPPAHGVAHARDARGRPVGGARSGRGR